MNILLIGEQTELQTQLKELLELAFPKSLVVDGDTKSSYQYLIDYKEKWNIAIFLAIESVKTRDKLLQTCLSIALPVLCIVKKEQNIYYTEFLQKGVKGVIGHDAPFDILRNSIYFVKNGGVYFDPKIVKDIDLNLPTQEEIKKEINLTEQQWDIFHFVAKGMTAEEIAKELSLTPTEILEEQHRIISITKSKLY